MARLKVLYPGNHTSSGNIGADVENIVRYFNSCELGDQTLAELLKKLFDGDGILKAPVELRKDNIDGLQYRVGETLKQRWVETACYGCRYSWCIRVDVGTIGAPLF